MDDKLSYLDKLRLRGFLVLVDQGGADGRTRLTVQPDSELTTQDRAEIRSNAREILTQISNENEAAERFHKWFCDNLDRFGDSICNLGYSPESMEQLLMATSPERIDKNELRNHRKNKHRRKADLGRPPA
ncbi:MAG: hypothetical protein KGL39_07840 [Patescibacteria group bacterium]|nr:hypothetical protein [Patescibacteria group bacterium]